MPGKIPSKDISRKPAAKSDEHRSLYLSCLGTMHEAAALPLVAISAWNALERSTLAASDHILIY
jgi:hypothetical protein